MTHSAPNPVHWPLADGRELLFFSLPGRAPAPVTDRRVLGEREMDQSQLRFDRQTGQWVIVARLRQDRTHMPSSDRCPLCPGPTGLISEVPAPDYDVVVFENRFPSLSGAGTQPFGLPDTTADAFVSAPGHGRCEVICFSSDHTGSFAGLELPHARLVVDAWRNRTADLMARPGIRWRQVSGLGGRTLYAMPVARIRLECRSRPSDRAIRESGTDTGRAAPRRRVRDRGAQRWRLRAICIAYSPTGRGPSGIGAGFANCSV